jgi:hypothetical protein
MQVADPALPCLAITGSIMEARHRTMLSETEVNRALLSRTAAVFLGFAVALSALAIILLEEGGGSKL